LIFISAVFLNGTVKTTLSLPYELHHRADIFELKYRYYNFETNIFLFPTYKSTILKMADVYKQCFGIVRTKHTAVNTQVNRLQCKQNHCSSTTSTMHV